MTSRRRASRATTVRDARATARSAGLALVLALGVAGGGPAAAAAADKPPRLDSSFGSGGTGTVTTNFGNNSGDYVYDALLQPDGKTVAVGSTDADGVDYIDTDFAVARYTADGTLDSSFGDGGKLITVFGSAARARAVAIQSDGKIVVVGRTGTGANNDDNFAVVRYDADGTLDSSFGSGGKLTTSFSEWIGESADGVAIQDDGKIVVVGRTAIGDNNSAVARYDADGTLDSSFGSAGKMTYTNGGLASKVLLQPDGKIVVAAAGAPGGGGGITRLRPDGTLDTSFSDDGTTANDGDAGRYRAPIALQDDGRIVATRTQDGSCPSSYLARLRPDGTLDPSFGGDSGGVGQTYLGGGTADGIVIDSDGRITTVGSDPCYQRSPDGSGSRPLVLSRVDDSGALDSSFGSGGQGVVNLGGDTAVSFPAALKQRPDGELVVAGSFSQRGGNPDPFDFFVSVFDVSSPPSTGGGDDTSGDTASNGDSSTDDDGSSGDTAKLARWPAPPAVAPAALQRPPAARRGGKYAAKLQVDRATVRRSARQLDVLAPISRRASGDLNVKFFAAGKVADLGDAPVDAAHRRVRFRKKISKAQADLGTGIMLLTYFGDFDTQTQYVRLRAAAHKAELRAGRPTIEHGRLRARGTISQHARGVVRVQVLYDVASEPTKVLQYKVPIRDGSYALDVKLPADVRKGIAERIGVVHSYTLFTGYYPRRIRGEMDSYQVLPPPSTLPAR